jgi:prepilin-type N-terminal cleavage/methylation domain-containing protein
MPHERRNQRHNHRKSQGFTLMEMAIVLVIIGLLVGGVLVGQDLIVAAQTSGQIAQIEKYNQSVNAFRTKYLGLPGDLIYSTAKSLNYSVGAAGGGTAGTICDGANLGERNGDGLIDGWPTLIYSQTVGETALFWEDLSQAGLIDGTYPKPGSIPTGQFNCCCALDVTGAQMANYFPPAKIGSNNSVYVVDYNGANWFGVANFTAVNHYGGVPTTAPNIRVMQAYNMDVKMDDGLPTTGSMQALYISATPPPSATPIPDTSIDFSSSAAADSATTCYNTTSSTYSTAFKSGDGMNCAVAIKFQ